VVVVEVVEEVVEVVVEAATCCRRAAAACGTAVSIMSRSDAHTSKWPTCCTSATPHTHQNPRLAAEGVRTMKLWPASSMRLLVAPSGWKYMRVRLGFWRTLVLPQPPQLARGRASAVAADWPGGNVGYTHRKQCRQPQVSATGSNSSCLNTSTALTPLSSGVVVVE
jgi:hypothetical protein